MQIPKSLVAASLAISLTVCIAPYPSQAASPVLQQPSSDAQQVVEIPILALSNKGEPVRDLAKDEIRVLDGKQEEDIVSLTATGAEPLRIGILVDISGSEREAARVATPQLLASFLQSIMRPDVYVFVIAFNAQGKMASEWTNDLTQLDRAVSSAHNAPRLGGSAVYEAIYWACTEKMARQRGRKALLLLSDLEDNSSNHTRDEAIAAAIASKTTVFPLVEVKRGYTPERVRRVSRDISASTAGLKFDVNGDKDFGRALEEIGAALAAGYTLSFISSAPSAKTEFHKIKIECARKGVKVLAPAGYFLLRSR